MKSIKEKAEEVFPLMPFERLGDIQCIRFNTEQEHKKEGFEAGANYVLDEIEKLVKFNRWAAQDLYELIEQLKK